MNKFIKKLNFFITPAIVLLLLMVIFFSQKLYPFGEYSIVQVDADYQFIPVLFRIWDFLHGNASIIYDDIGLGNNIYISMIIQGSLFSPINLLLYLTSRVNILNFFNIMVITKICLLSLTSYIYINYKFKVNEFYKILFSVLYALSGWVMLNYFNIMWLDSVILFPLIIMYLDKLLLNGNAVGYIITLGLSLAISYYISFFILIFILFYSFFNLYLFTDIDKRMKIIFKLGISTVIAILLASFSLLPALYQTLISSRFDSESNALMFDAFMNKSLYLMGSSLFIILFIKLFLKINNDRKKVFFFVILLLLFIGGLFFEPINLALHLGSHWSFPYRYSFITIFILMMGSLYYINKYSIRGTKFYYWIIPYILLLFGGIYLNNYYLEEIIDSQVVLDFDDLDVYINIVIIFVISLILSYIAINFKNKYLRYITISISSLFIIFVYASWTMYYSDGYFLTKNSVEINNNLVLPRDGRYKMNYTVYTPSYSFIYDVATLDNWLHILPSSEVSTYRALGYETSDTCIRSYGGTVFSDWLLNFKYILSEHELDDEMYIYVDHYDKYYLYEYNYQSGFGVEYEFIEEMDISYLKPFEVQNYVASNILGKEIIKVDNYYVDNNNEYNISYEIKEKGFLYLYGEGLKDLVDYVRINNNYIYKFDNYIKYLGIYDEDIDVYVSFKENVYRDIQLGFISYDEIKNLSNLNKLNNNSLEVIGEGNQLFLPINNIPGLKIYNNSELVDLDTYLGNFVAIKLQDGNNKIEIKYEMPLFTLGIILSIIGVILLSFNKYIIGNKLIYNISEVIYYYMTLGLIFYFYVYSFIKYMN